MEKGGLLRSKNLRFQAGCISDFVMHSQSGERIVIESNMLFPKL